MSEDMGLIRVNRFFYISYYASKPHQTLKLAQNHWELEKKKKEETLGKKSTLLIFEVCFKIGMVFYLIDTLLHFCILQEFIQFHINYFGEKKRTQSGNPVLKIFLRSYMIS